MNTDNSGKKLKKQEVSLLKKLLGNLELEVMECMWQTEEATVQQVVETINRRRPIAYTTVMTVMVHLVEKGLLIRKKEGKRYRYRLAKNRDEFLYETSRSKIRTLLADFGDLAIAGFLGEINNIDAARLEKLRGLAREGRSEDSGFE